MCKEKVCWTIFFVFFSGCCEGCPKLSYFEECVYSSISYEDMVEEHVDFIKSGYCSCNESQERKTKVTLADLV